MRKMTLLAGLAAAAVAGIGSAQAAPGSWTGFYLGANAGRLSADSDGANTAPCDAACNYFFPVNADLINTNGGFGSSDVGTVGGLTAGFNNDAGGWFWGVEGDVDTADTSSESTLNILYSATTNGNYFSNTIETNWIATVRARVGISTPHALLYVTAGGAFAGADLKTEIAEHIGGVPNGEGGSSDRNDTLSGWTAGVGAEVMLGSSNWSAKIDYLYADFGSIDGDTLYENTADDTIHTTADLNASLLRVGLNFHF